MFAGVFALVFGCLLRCLIGCVCLGVKGVCLSVWGFTWVWMFAQLFDWKCLPGGLGVRLGVWGFAWGFGCLPD